MNMTFKAAVVAGSMAFAASSADAITVPEGEQLVLQLSGFYSTVGGVDIAEGVQLNFSNVVVSNINTSSMAIDLDGLTQFSSVSVTGNPWTLQAGAVNDGVSLTLNGTVGGAVFDLDQGFGLVIPPAATGTYALDGFGDLDGDLGSWSFSTTGTGTGGAFTFALGVPPIVTPPGEVPLPAAGMLLVGALGALGVARRRAAA